LNMDRYDVFFLRNKIYLKDHKSGDCDCKDSARLLNDLSSHGQDEQCDRDKHKPEHSLFLSGDRAAEEKEKKSQYIYLENPHNYP
jgi:hypothetical protein